MRKLGSPKCLVKEKVSPIILKIVRTTTGTIVDIVTQEPESNGEQIGQIEELVANNITQELLLTKGQTKEIVANTVSTRTLEENVVVGTNL